MFSPSRAFRSFGLVFLSLGLAHPGMLLAQGPGCCAPAPCARRVCAPPVTCCAPPPPPDVCTCTTYKPVCETCYHQQPIMTYHDVCRTCYRQEPYCVTVPVTKIDCITCDEGCYKMVWCPQHRDQASSSHGISPADVLPHRTVHGHPARAAGDDADRSRVPRPLLSGNAYVHQAAVQSVPVLPDAVCSELRQPVAFPATGDPGRAPRRKRSPQLRPCSRSSPRPRPPPFNWLRPAGDHRRTRNGCGGGKQPDRPVFASAIHGQCLAGDSESDRPVV